QRIPVVPRANDFCHSALLSVEALCFRDHSLKSLKLCKFEGCQSGVCSCGNYPEAFPRPCSKIFTSALLWHGVYAHFCTHAREEKYEFTRKFSLSKTFFIIFDIFLCTCIIYKTKNSPPHFAGKTGKEQTSTEGRFLPISF
ncbi:MAG: hypothetical protein RR300_05925, partial [Raoultibacter sp.]